MQWKGEYPMSSPDLSLLSSASSHSRLRQLSSDNQTLSAYFHSRIRWIFWAQCRLPWGVTAFLSSTGIFPGPADADSAIYAVTSGDAGHTWGTPKVIGYDRFYRRYISAIRIPSGGVLAVWPGSKGIVQAESDSTVSAWSTPHVIRPNPLAVLDLRLHSLADDLIWLTYLVSSSNSLDYIIMVMASTDGGRSWSSPRTLLTGPECLPGLTATGSGQIAMFYSPSYNTGIVRSVTNDNGQTWTGGDTVLFEGASSRTPWLLRTENDTLLILYTVSSYTNIPGLSQDGSLLTQEDVWLARSTDDGITWTDRERLTRYAGVDRLAGADLLHGAPFFVFHTHRWQTRRYSSRLWNGVAGSDQDLHLPPAMLRLEGDYVHGWEDVRTWVNDEVGVAGVTLIPRIGGILRPGLPMYDDGLHNDFGSGDQVYGVRVDSAYAFEDHSYGYRIVDVDGNVVEAQPPMWSGYYSAAHTVGNVALDIGFDGNLGDDFYQARWPKSNGKQYLSLASFWFGAVANTVPFSVRSNYQSSDGGWRYTPTVPRVVPSGKADEEYIVSFAHSIVGKRVTVRQHSYQWSAAGRDDFIIFEFDCWNKEQGTTFQDVYVSLWSDPDVTVETLANDDLGGIDEPRNMIYLHDADQNPAGLIGFVLLSHAPSGFVFYRSKEDPKDAAQRYGYLSRTGVGPTTLPDDYRMMVNAGPFTLTPGDSCQVAYGMVLGINLAELQVNADSMIQIYKSTLTAVQERSRDEGTPRVFVLHQNHPNPFNPNTTIRYELPTASEVRLTVYDILGRELSTLVNERRDVGVHEVTFDGSSISSGVYFYRLQAGGVVQSRKMVIVK